LLQRNIYKEYVQIAEAQDISKVFEGFIKSDVPFDKWFRDKILVEVHEMDFSKPLPMNELMLDFKA
jgi:hypothetical protein